MKASVENPRYLSDLAGRVPFSLPCFMVADTHFFHRKIRDYCGRPKDHERLMISSWQELVGPEDVIVHLGDLALGRPEQIQALAPKLPGRKHLLKGNHDRRSRSFYASIGFPVVKPFMLRHRGWEIVFTHRPDYDHLYLGAPRRLNVHGHIHERVLEDRRFVNLSVEQTDYRPVCITDILDSRIDELER